MVDAHALGQGADHQLHIGVGRREKITDYVFCQRIFIIFRGVGHPGDRKGQEFQGILSERAHGVLPLFLIFQAEGIGLVPAAFLGHFQAPVQCIQVYDGSRYLFAKIFSVALAPEEGVETALPILVRIFEHTRLHGVGLRLIIGSRILLGRERGQDLEGHRRFPFRMEAYCYRAVGVSVQAGKSPGTVGVDPLVIEGAAYRGQCFGRPVGGSGLAQ